jgi:hypothetical protein
VSGIEINARTYHGLAMPRAASNSWFCMHRHSCFHC